MPQLPQFFLRGQPVSRLVADGDYTNGILETMHCQNGSLPLWPLHRARLARNTILNKSLLAKIDRITPLLAAGCTSKRAVARLRIGLISEEKCWDLSFLPLVSTQEAELGVHLFPCQTCLLTSESKNLGCKLLSRSRYNVAKAELPAGKYLDGLMLDNAGRVIESLRCNLLARFGNTWVTPDLRRCGVRGVMLEWLHERIHWQQRDMDIQVLSSADEIVLCNSVRGILPVVEIIGYKSWSVGAGARSLQQLIVETLW